MKPLTVTFPLSLFKNSAALKIKVGVVEFYSFSAKLKAHHNKANSVLPPLKELEQTEELKLTL
ncbi:hypothetical protein [Candidatus Odyssella acanthamoebae]|uniref:Uncharacterized protein n=1 Tax=Candidatus Odyssella acanthamoebae TaxID=91604 RepID=A0A077AWJ1_9PROT|nr:hypothetical protein [Candidatus Paracaedibacter acanthamoebae]AIK96003.1 hypothetical protein ID47_03485 [Candidatus Paracaedibacter acanthamoebae]